jgi:hypothetical protein
LGNWMFPECSLSVPWMFPECSLHVPWVFTEFSPNWVAQLTQKDADPSPEWSLSKMFPKRSEWSLTTVRMFPAVDPKGGRSELQMESVSGGVVEGRGGKVALFRGLRTAWRARVLARFLGSVA